VKCISRQDEGTGNLGAKGGEFDSWTHFRGLEHPILFVEVNEVEGEDARNGRYGMEGGKP